MVSALLAAEDVVAGYLPGVDILTGCSLDLHSGEIVGIIGPNGAGKSTLLKAIFGLVEVRAGAVRFEDENITGLEPHQLVSRGVGFVPQNDNVFGRLSIRENLEMGAFQAPERFAERFEVVADLFPLLADRSSQRADGLSGGERQMVAIGRALMADPRVLLLDEPSSGLSPAYQDQVFEQITHVTDHGVSLVMVEQNAHRCLQICDRAYVLDQGANAHEGTGLELLDDPKVVSLYLGTLARF
ncbi:MAG: ABC transporter ATP-binding protein [Acidimicrobiaceae bacterium]|nr:ABC transporter ATP-binding protein [Acidimicrobiaceae bacterium]MXW76557.1 ABC transporter ATP-binding protein [Acidimicrobiaceae bacterium]MYC42851.1 ABC transporter ATP-binding protein [Acidimicrobiaceae bacterium]MYD08352.1 ABC transporter ATP-binding protein [Acidimicrobiaceae bacterium]MYH88968.1 ABC transporter ATP-binding protein [Acidimicrobiaceae bacterium]